jgi:hypothetical protein
MKPVINKKILQIKFLIKIETTTILHTANIKAMRPVP